MVDGKAYIVKSKEKSNICWIQIEIGRLFRRFKNKPTSCLLPNRGLVQDAPLGHRRLCFFIRPAWRTFSKHPLLSLQSSDLRRSSIPFRGRVDHRKRYQGLTRGRNVGDGTSAFISEGSAASSLRWDFLFRRLEYIQVHEYFERRMFRRCQWGRA